jgi:hypothetical protein
LKMKQRTDRVLFHLARKPGPNACISIDNSYDKMMKFLYVVA